jgi:hypothetical protein
VRFKDVFHTPSPCCLEFYQKNAPCAPFSTPQFT